MSFQATEVCIVGAMPSVEVGEACDVGRRDFQARNAVKPGSPPPPATDTSPSLGLPAGRMSHVTVGAWSLAQ